MASKVNEGFYRGSNLYKNWISKVDKPIEDAATKAGKKLAKHGGMKLKTVETGLLNTVRGWFKKPPVPVQKYVVSGAKKKGFTAVLSRLALKTGWLGSKLVGSMGGPVGAVALWFAPDLIGWAWKKLTGKGGKAPAQAAQQQQATQGYAGAQRGDVKPSYEPQILGAGGAFENVLKGYERRLSGY